MDKAQNSGVLHVKRGELVLEKFFVEYITLWYHERRINAYTYDKARQEIDILKGKQKQTSENVDQKETLDDRKSDLQMLLLKNFELEKTLSQMKDKIYQVRADADIELREKEHKLAEMKESLAKYESHVYDSTQSLNELAGDKLRQGNPDQAELSDPNRPTEIGKLFSEVYDSEWSDAFENIPKMEEEKRIGVLHGIVTKAFSFCEKKFEEQTMYVRAILLGLEPEGTSDIETVRSINIHNVLAKTRKQLAHETAGNLANEFSSTLFEQLVSGLGMSKNTIHTTLRNYARRCIELCWLMVVCEPQMALSEDKEGKPFDTNVYKPYTKSTKDMNNPVVKLRVWPALHLYMDGSLVAKGVAQPGEGHQKPK